MTDLRDTYKDDLDFGVLALQDSAFKKQYRVADSNRLRFRADHAAASKPTDNWILAIPQQYSKRIPTRSSCPLHKSYTHIFESLTGYLAGSSLKAY